MKLINDIDYEDIYDNIDDYEYPYNHINREEERCKQRSFPFVYYYTIS